MPRVHFTKKARKDYPQYDIKKGESYYFWTPFGSSKRVSKTHPKPWQLTNSAFKQSVYHLIDDAQNTTISNSSDVESLIDFLKSALETLRDEAQESLDNMPEQLQESSPSGYTLTERIETLDSAMYSLDCIDTHTNIDLDEDNVHVHDEFDDWVDNIKSEIDEALSEIAL